MLVEVKFDRAFEKLYLQWEREYPELLAVQGVSKDFLDFSSRSKRYFKEHVSDLTIDKNANTSYLKSPTSYASELTKPLYKLHGLFLLWKYAKKRYGERRASDLVTRIVTGDLYFHDSSGILVQVPYCVSISAADIAVKGMPFNSQLVSRPPRHADSFVAQTVETMFNVGNQVAGAVAVPDFLAVLSTFTKRDGLTNSQIRQLLQRFVFSLNQPMRSGVQSLFSNVSVYDEFLLKTFCQVPDLDISEAKRVQRVFAELISEGVDGIPFKFPVATANVFTGDGSNGYFLDQLGEWNAPCVWNIYADKRPKLSMCCRLSLDVSDQVFFNTFGSGDVKTGSTRVVTLNLPRIALLAKGDHRKFMTLLDDQMEAARQLLLTHRDILKERISQGFLVFFNFGFMILERMFSTFGVVGLYEMAELMEIAEDAKKVQFIEEVLDHIERRAKEFSKEDGFIYNVEQIPAEQAAFTLATLDKLLFDHPKLPVYEELGYSNQFIPLYVDVPLKDRIDLTGKLDSKTSGGGILHINVGERISPKQMTHLVRYAASKTVYFAINYVANVCRTCNCRFVGTGDCPKCGEKDDIDRVTRVVGYYSPIRNWSKERRREFEQRVFYRDLS